MNMIDRFLILYSGLLGSVPIIDLILSDPFYIPAGTVILGIWLGMVDIAHSFRCLNDSCLLK